jgi:hypothetical protein
VGLLLLAGVGAAAPVQAQSSGRATVDEENDNFGSRQDRHYTQGLRVSYLSPSITGGSFDAPFAWLSDHLSIFDDDAPQKNRKVEWTILGQSIFTPEDLTRTKLDPRDRPYAGWLYTGGRPLQESTLGSSGRMLENLELSIGIVGPAALGREAQNDVHQYIGVILASPPHRGGATSSTTTRPDDHLRARARTVDFPSRA